MFGANTSDMRSGTKMASVYTHELINISIYVTNSRNWLHFEFVYIGSQYNVPSNDRASPILRLPAKTFHQDFTGSTFKIFGPTDMT